ncbi:hypothetical protein [Nocardia testacea]|uniref:Zinc ribbon domain-containing protein n=1 Tax=Nocardia testacea TaxID=248551 RepID=A0ABW7VSP7_9NOCA
MATSPPVPNPSMDDGHLCDNCGAANAVDAEFCAQCGRFMGLSTGSSTLGGRTLASETPIVAQSRPATSDGRASTPAAAPLPRPRNDSTRRGEARPPRVGVPTPEVIIDPERGGTFELQVHNTSSVVDRFRARPIDPPTWLKLTYPEITLYPDQEETASITIVVESTRWPAAQRFMLSGQVYSDEDPQAATDFAIAVTVPPVGDPAELRAEPAQVRLRDATSERIELKLDNRGSNFPQRFELTGSDPEDVAEFEFSATIVEVPPGEALSVDVTLTVPAPEADKPLTRRLTISGANDQATIETQVTVEQETSAVQLRLDPTVIKARDVPHGEGGLIIDNRRGGADRRIQLAGRDPEGAVRLSFRESNILVRAGTESRTGFRVQSTNRPTEAEVTRTFTVVASDGTNESTVDGTFVETTTPAPIITAAIRLEPEQLNTRDQIYGRFRALVDNTRGSRTLSVRLAGADPERAVGFDFDPWVLDVPAGRVSQVGVTVSAALPASGETLSREITVIAGNRDGSVQARAALTQAASPAPITLAKIHLEPEQFTLHNSARGQLRVVVENKSRALPLHVRLSGRDPERAVWFSFDPPRLDIAAGQVGWANVAINAPRPGTGRQIVRNLQVAADDGDAMVEAKAQLTQTTADFLPLIRIVCTLLGGLFAVVGAFRPWAQDDSWLVPLYNVTDFPGVGDFQNFVGEIGDIEVADSATQTSQPIARAIVLVLAVIMMLGVLRAKGTLTVVAALLMAVVTIGFLVYASVVFSAAVGGSGAVLVFAGAVLGCVGGLCVRRRKS